MPELYFVLKTIHILSSTILFGTGIGIAFFMYRSWHASDIREKRYAARGTVLADTLFTFPAAIIQPLSGIGLIYLTGFDWTSLWLVITYCIYIMAAICWIPVVWIQIQLKNMCEQANDSATELPPAYHKLFKIWFFLGWPAFLGLIVVFYLMIAKPM